MGKIEEGGKKEEWVRKRQAREERGRREGGEREESSGGASTNLLRLNKVGRVRKVLPEEGAGARGEVAVHVIALETKLLLVQGHRAHVVRLVALDRPVRECFTCEFVVVIYLGGQLVILHAQCVLAAAFGVWGAGAAGSAGSVLLAAVVGSFLSKAPLARHDAELGLEHNSLGLGLLDDNLLGIDCAAQHEVGCISDALHDGVED